MAYRFNSFVFFCVLMHTIASGFTVKVLLHELNEGRVLSLQSSGGFELVDPTQLQEKMDIAAADITVAQRANGLYVNGKRLRKQQIYIRPKKEPVFCDDTEYGGMFLLAQKEGKGYCINCIDLEEYVFSVLKTESWPGWPIEVNKAFSIAARSYVLSMAQRAEKSGLLYHVKNTNVHQTYQGTHACPVIRAAVDQTRGLFLAHGHKPILAMYDSSCGGVVPKDIADFDFSVAPYLARDYPCLYCKRCSIYSWKVVIKKEEFEQLLAQHNIRVRKIRDIVVTQRDGAGLVQQLKIRGAGKSVNLSAQRLYSMMKGVKSFCFEIKRTRQGIALEGRGYGHHIGLCQWGAREMVRDGWDHKKIVAFYYPGSTLARLK